MHVLVDRAHVPVPEAICHPEDRVEPVDEGGEGADRDKGIHVRLQMEEAEHPVLEVMPEKDEGRDGEKRLEEDVQEGVLLPVEKGGKGDPDHRAHRDVHEEQEEENARDELPQFLVETVFLGIWKGLCRLIPFSFGNRAVAAPADREEDVLFLDRSVLPFDLHAVGKKGDAAFLHPRELPYGPLDMGLAGGAGHPLDQELLPHLVHLLTSS